MRIHTAKEGDYRYITKFLWFPRKFDSTWVWLETVTIRQKYIGVFPLPPWANICLTDPATEEKLGIKRK